MAELVLVIPCYNEADRLPVDIILKYAREHRNVEFLMVNDGSRDRTLEVLRGMAEAMPDSFSVLDLQPNGGKAEAVRRGLDQAMAADSDFVGFWDADLATPLGEIERFLEILRSQPQVDIVLGSRIRLLGRNIERKPVRHYLGRIFATAASLLLQLPVYDTQCGAKMLRVHDGNRGLLVEPFMSGWIFDVELLLRYLAQRDGAADSGSGSTIVEIPLLEWVDVAGSKVKLSAFLAAGRQLFSMWRYYGRGGKKRVIPARAPQATVLEKPDSGTDQ